MRQLDVPARPLKFLPQGVQRRLSIGPSHGRAGTAGRHRTPGRGTGRLMAANTTYVPESWGTSKEPQSSC